MEKIYVTPLSGRYASKEMNEIWSNDSRYSTWRKLWVALAETEKELGIDITDEQIAEMKAHVEDIDYDVVSAREKECRHDVMAHVYEFGTKCPSAKGIIHLGATSCYVTDNAEVILMNKALEIIKEKLLLVIANLKEFAIKNKDITCLGYTHFQAAQLTTVGKRRDTLASRFTRRLRRTRICTKSFKASWMQRYDWNTRKFYEAI